MTFLLNSAVGDLALAQGAGFGTSADKLAAPSVYSELTDIEHKDMARVKQALELNLVRYDKKGVLELSNIVTAGGKSVSIFNPPDMQFFFNEKDVLLNGQYIAVKCRIKDKHSKEPRDYHALFSTKKDSDNGFRVEVCKDEEYKKALVFMKRRGYLLTRAAERKEDAKAIERYIKSNEEIIDSFILERIKACDFAELEGRAQELGWDSQYPDRIRPTKYWNKDTFWSEFLYRPEFFNALGVYPKTIFNGKNIVFIKVPKGTAFPVIEEDGRKVPVTCHSSNNAVYFFLDCTTFDAINDPEEGSFPETILIKAIIKDVIHEMGAVLGLPFIVTPVGRLDKIENELDRLYDQLYSPQGHYPNSQEFSRDYPNLAKLKSKSFPTVDLDVLVGKDVAGNPIHRDYAASSRDAGSLPPVPGPELPLKIPADDLSRALTAMTSVVKILLADEPADKATAGEIQKLVASFGDRAQLIKDKGRGKDKKWLAEVIVRERPAIVLVRGGTTAFKNEDDYKDFVEFARKNGVLAVIRMGAGVDNVNLKAADAAKMSVFRTHGNANSVANLALRFLLFGLECIDGAVHSAYEDLTGAPDSRLETILDVPISDFREKAYKESQDEGRGKSDVHNIEYILHNFSAGHAKTLLQGHLKGKTIGLVGFGSTAQALAAKLNELRKLLDMKFRIMATSTALDGLDKNPAKVKERRDAAKRLGVDYFDHGEETVLKESDILSLHLSLTDDTKKWLNKNRLKLAKKAKLIINTARQEIVDGEALREFLTETEKKDRYYLADADLAKGGVAKKEHLELLGLEKDLPLQVFLTPHIAASTQDAGEKVKERTVLTLRAVIKRLLGLKPTTNFEPELMNDIPVTPLAPQGTSEAREADDMFETFGTPAPRPGRADAGSGATDLFGKDKLQDVAYALELWRRYDDERAVTLSRNTKNPVARVIALAKLAEQGWAGSMVDLWKLAEEPPAGTDKRIVDLAHILIYYLGENHYGGRVYDEGVYARYIKGLIKSSTSPVVQLAALVVAQSKGILETETNPSTLLLEIVNESQSDIDAAEREIRKNAAMALLYASNPGDWAGFKPTLQYSEQNSTNPLIKIIAQLGLTAEERRAGEAPVAAGSTSEPVEAVLAAKYYDEVPVAGGPDSFKPEEALSGEEGSASEARMGRTTAAVVDSLTAQLEATGSFTRMPDPAMGAIEIIPQGTPAGALNRITHNVNSGELIILGGVGDLLTSSVVIRPNEAAVDVKFGELVFKAVYDGKVGVNRAIVVVEKGVEKVYIVVDSNFAGYIDGELKLSPDRKAVEANLPVVFVSEADTAKIAELEARGVKVAGLEAQELVEVGRIRKEIAKVAPVVRDIWDTKLPTDDRTRYTLLLPNEFFANNEEFKAHRDAFKDRFDLNWVSGRDHAEFISKVLDKAAGKEGRTIVFIPQGMPQDQLQRLLNAKDASGKALRFILADAGILTGPDYKSDEYRRNFQLHTYLAMLLVRHMDEKTRKDANVYAALSFYLKRHFKLDGIGVDDYIDEIINGSNVKNLIKAILVYKPAVQHRVPEYATVIEPLVRA